MSSEALDITADMLSAIGLLTDKPEIEAAGAFISAVSGGLDMANQPETPAVSDQWQGLENQLDGYQPALNVYDSSELSHTDQSEHLYVNQDVHSSALPMGVSDTFSNHHVDHSSYDHSFLGVF